MARQGRFRFAAACAAAAAVVCAVAVPRPASAVATREEVDAAIARGQGFLLSQMKPSGRWEPDPVRKGNAHDWASLQGLNWGGYSAIATYALLASGKSPQDKDVARAIEFLKDADITGVYSLSMRVQVWTYLPRNAQTRELFRKDVAQILRTLNTKGEGAGLWDYLDLSPESGPIDHSVSQFAVLALWAAANAGVDVGDRLWATFDKVWKEHQYDDGGWVYDGNGRDAKTRTPAMTAAGIATLFITQEYAFEKAALSCDGNPTEEHIDRGLQWISDNFKDVKENTYLWYGIERIGAASGRKYFGEHDWYAKGTDDLLRTQDADGSWRTNFPGASPIPNTAFALLFLARGRSPIVMNKLDHGVEVAAAVPAAKGVTATPAAKGAAAAPAAKGAPAAAAAKGAAGPAGGGAGGSAGAKAGDWNQRPRDVSSITRWIGQQGERYLGWQVVDLRGRAKDLLDAPILYMSGSGKIVLTDDEVGKLRRFVEYGGLILGNADCGKQAFADDFRKLGEAMFPAYRFRELPADHPILSGQQFRADKWKERVSIQGLSNGSRELMLLVPEADPGRAWHQRADRNKEHLFQLAANVYLYATEKQTNRVKGQTHVVEDVGFKPERTVGVARLQVGPGWDPEPGGWRRLAQVMVNEQRVGLNVMPVRPGDGQLSVRQAPVAHLTGTSAFELDAKAREELKRFVADGGTLVVEAAGGAAPFADAAERELAATFGEAAVLEPLPPDHPIFTNPAAPIARVAYRRAAAAKLTGDLKTPRLRGITVSGGRVGVVFSREDLSTGLVGHAVDGVLGYEPASATAVMRNLVLYGAGINKPVTAVRKLPPGPPGKNAGAAPVGDGL